jgi:hypothetical protein
MWAQQIRQRYTRPINVDDWRDFATATVEALDEVSGFAGQLALLSISRTELTVIWLWDSRAACDANADFQDTVLKTLGALVGEDPELAVESLEVLDYHTAPA